MKTIHDSHVDLKMADDRGRKIGAHVVVWHDAAGFNVRVHATRDGKTFGALPKHKTVRTGMQANAEIKRRLGGMARRYAKQANLRARGLHATWKDPLTGRTLTMVDAADVETDPTAGRYFVICEEHGSCVGVDTKRAGRSCSTLDFCDDCREAHEAQSC